MCHVLLFLPVIALPVLWLLPLSVALPVYGMAFALALWVYALAVRTARRRAMTGAEGMIGERGRVVQLAGRTAKVLIHGELWSAEVSGERLAIGEEVLVLGITGLKLKIKAAAGAHAH
jgi:membrane-bound serine protease (ClpP class)